MNNKQRWMGGVVLLGGGVLLAALLLKGKEEIQQNDALFQAQHPVELARQPNTSGSSSEAIQLQEMTVDIETEKRLLEEQRIAREKAVAEQQAKTAEYLRNQQNAEAEAARKAAEEYAAMNARRNAAQQSSDNIPPELTAEAKTQLDAQKSPAQLAAEKKAVEQKSAEKKAAEQKALEQKAAEQKKQQEAAAKKQAEQRQADEKKRLDEVKKKAEQERKRKADEEAKKKAEADKARDLLENGDKQWMVQVALAANQANADALTSKLNAKGYKVRQSPTSKGVRIMVGPAKDRETADGMRKKITTDASLNLKSAWVIEWAPLEQR